MRPLSSKIVALGLAALLVTALLAIFEATAQDKSHKTLGQGSCGSGQSQCHKVTFSGWYDDDPHQNTIEKLNEEEKNSTRYARPFDLDFETLFDGSSMCMDCHGTVITGRENDYTEYGVGCESCHGPAEHYLADHDLGDVKANRTRTGYLDALSKGLVKLEEVTTLAETCVGCHLITDEKLRRAGHGDGLRFGYRSKLKSVADKKHWKRYKLNDRKKDSFGKATTALVEANKPSVIIAEPPPGNPQITNVIRKVDTLIIYRTGSVTPVTLPTFPELSDSLSFADLMLLIASRIEVVGKSIGDRK